MQPNTPNSTYAPYRHSFTAMASPCVFHLYGKPELCQQAALQAEHEIRRIEKKYSRYQPDSLLSQINANAGLKPTEVDQETWQLLLYAKTAWQQSNGLFDISSGILRKAWDFRRNALPSEQDILPLLCHIGFEKIQLENQMIFLPKHMQIDFGGFGKEYAADQASEVITQMGITSGIIDLGGDLNILGAKPDGTPWLLATQHPRDTEQAFASLPVSEGGMATSGDYERFMMVNHQRYCHILNPKTGWPVDYWASVTVITGSCLLAGTLATITMLKGETGLDWLQEQGVSYLCIYPSLHYESYRA